MDKISIVEVDLGEVIENIIADDVATITQKNRADIDAAVAESKQLAQVRVAREQAQQATTDKVEQAYQLLIDAEANNQTVPALTLLSAVQPEITGLNSLVQRLRTLLKAKGEGKVLSNMRKQGAAYYYLSKAV